MAQYDYDLFVIGGGSGGVRAARIAASHGARVALAEEYRVGGTCVIRGCVPKKLMVYAARYADDFEDALGFGWDAQPPDFDWSRLIAAKDKEIDRLNGAYGRTLERAGVTVFHSRAELATAHRVQLAAEGRSVTAGTILIATGSTPVLDSGLTGVEHGITSNEMFHLERLPERIAIVGGGFIAIEFAGIMNGLGVATTLVYRGEEILRGFDDECRTLLHSEMEKRGITVLCGETFARIDKTPAGLVGTTVTGRRIEADEILFAIGRRPHTAGLGLEVAGVATGPDGAVIVDEFSRTSVDNIYAVGDVTDRLNLTPAAIREGHAFADTVFGGKPRSVDHANAPKAVFSTPEFGSVGLTEAEAKARHAAVDVYRAQFKPMRHTLSGRDEKMLMKLLVDGETDRVLGCHIVGHDAAEMAQLMAVVIGLKAKKADLDATMALHPSAAEELVTMSSPSERWRREG